MDGALLLLLQLLLMLHPSDVQSREREKGLGVGGGEHLVAKRAPASEVRTVKAELDNVNQDTCCVLKEVSQSNMCLNKNIICSVMNKS